MSTTCHPVCDFFVFGIKKRKKGVHTVYRYQKLDVGQHPFSIGTIIGGNVMLGFTTVFDREAGKIGFAKSTCQCKEFAS